MQFCISGSVPDVKFYTELFSIYRHGKHTAEIREHSCGSLVMLYPALNEGLNDACLADRLVSHENELGHSELRFRRFRAWLRAWVRSVRIWLGVRHATAPSFLDLIIPFIDHISDFS